MSKRINKPLLVEDIMLHNVFADASKAQITDFVEFFFDKISSHVVAGNEVFIPGFGKFENFTLSNGVHTPKFRPAKAFKESVRA